MGAAKTTARGYRYVVASGDTMLGISARFGVCVRDLTAANDDNLEIVADQTLQIQRVTALRVGSSECSVTST